MRAPARQRVPTDARLMSLLLRTDTIGRATIHRAAQFDWIKTLPDAVAHAVVCDPSSLFLAKEPGAENLARRPEFWAECLRVLKPGGHIVAVGDARTQHRLVSAIEDGGFEIRDQLGWLYGSGMPKNRKMRGEWSGWSSTLKPCWEPICLARKPFSGSTQTNLEIHGVGALHIAACRIDLGGRHGVRGSHGKKQSGAQARMSSNDMVDRWPGNLIHDGSITSLSVFPSEPTLTGVDAARDAANSEWLEPTVAKYFFVAKASRCDREEGCEHLLDRFMPASIKPTQLLQHLVRLVVPKGGTVLDPFMRAGTTGKAAALEGAFFIGVEPEPDFYEVAKARIRFADRVLVQRHLFK